jgi:hypothetical protein
LASSSFFFSCYFSSFHCIEKETSERKEGEEAPVESQRKKKKKNLQFHSKGNICSNSLFVATTAAAQEPSLKRSLARSHAQFASSAWPPPLSSSVATSPPSTAQKKKPVRERKGKKLQ